MTQLSLTLDFGRVKGLIDKLKLETMKEPVEEELRGTLEKMRDAARKAAKPHAGDTGHTASMIVVELGGSESPLGGRLISKHPASSAINDGRAPGRMPPAGPLEAWAIRHGMGRGLGFAIAKKIARRGTKGLHFMEKAHEVGQKELGPTASRALDRIIKRLNS